MHASEEDIREVAPYEGAEFRAALARILKNPVLPAIVATHFPKLVLPDFEALVRSFENADQLQEKIIGVAIKSFLKRTSQGLTCSGLETLDRSRKYLFLSNHRDIICDSALLSYQSTLYGLRTPAICLGDNLLANPWVSDLVKANKGITVKRTATQRELLRWSVVLSEFIRRRIASGEESVWIAHREGRSKDGDDRTNPGLLKMLGLSGEGEPLERLAKLHVVPVSVSYELDPCDALKARELFLTARDGKYEKDPSEDRRQMMLGIQGTKGRIHIAVGEESAPLLQRASSAPNRKEQFALFSVLIDRAMHRLYKLWPTNYIAYDLLHKATAMQEHYDEEERIAFRQRMALQLASVEGDGVTSADLRPHFLAQYANPVWNSL